MIEFSAGNFKAFVAPNDNDININLWVGGCYNLCDFSHKELSDLLYVLEQAAKAAAASLPGERRWEV